MSEPTTRHQPLTAEAISDLVRLAIRDGRYSPECGSYPATVNLSIDLLTQLGCVPDNLEYPAEPVSDFSKSNPKLHKFYVLLVAGSFKNDQRIS